MGLDREQLSISLRSKGLIKNERGEWVKNSSIHSGQITKLESNTGDGSLEPAKVQEGSSQKFFVRVTSFRKRLIDEDNLCEKYHVDLCRYAGIMPSDAPTETRILVGQEKVKTDQEERVEIKVYEL